MTMFTAEALIASADNLHDYDRVIRRVRAAYLDWLSTQEPTDWQPVGELQQHPAMRHDRAAGSTCIAACRAGADGMPALAINDSKGCGAVMRVAPIGLVTAWSAETAFDLGLQSGALTHGHASGYLPAGCMAFIIRKLIDGADLVEAARGAINLAGAWARHEETVELIQAALDTREVPDVITFGVLGQGWTGDEALAIGLAAVLAGGDFVDVVARAANHDGDSDSTASIAGQLYGAQHGVTALPASWIEKLDISAILNKMVHHFTISP